MNTTINIPLSKNKLTWIIIASIFFIMFCTFMFLKADWIGENNAGIKIISKYGGIVGVFFFIFTMLQAIKKRKDENVGFSITSQGFYDNSSAAKLGLISWKDIIGFKEWTFEGTKSLVVLVDNPKEYIELETSFIVRKMLQANHTGCGSPIVISATALTISYEQLKEYVIDAYVNHNETIINHIN
jgi:hypothetical protein